MTNTQENRLSMFLAARDFLLQNNAATSVLPNFVHFFDAAKSGITEIQSWVEQQEFNKTGIAIEKKKIKDTLIVKAMDIANRLFAFAKFRNDSILMKEIGYKESELRKTTDTLMKEKCQIVFDKGSLYAADLVQYGVSQNILDELKRLISDYDTSLPAPRIGIMEKKQATEKLAALFDQVNLNFDQLDTLVETLRYSDTVFYKGYQGARKIVNAGHGFLSLKGIVIDKNNSVPIQNVKIVLSLQLKNPGDAAAVIEKKSAPKGGFNIRNMPAGSWNVSVTKEGYADQTFQIGIVSGETTMLLIKL
jgi:hypothetical protein